MRVIQFRLFAAVALAALMVASCSSSGSNNVAPPADGGGGLDGGLEESGGPAMALCSGVVTQTPPATNACAGDPTRCLSGIATTSFIALPAHRCASVYRTFPEGTAQPLQSQLIAQDDTWAFSDLSPWAHYYVFVVDDFAVSDGGSSVPAILGPLTIPVPPPDAGGALQAAVKPVQLALLESSTTGGSWQVQWASAHVFDPKLGSEIADRAQVSVVIGGTPTSMPWTRPPGTTGPESYFVQFSPPPAAQPSYSILTVDPSLGTKPVAWSLVAAPPSYVGSITAPTDGAMVPANAPLVVSWGAQPAADFVLTELFAKGDAGAWSVAYTSPQPNDSSVTTETIPKEKVLPGQYLLNLAFSSANCPATADGCVFANSIAVAQFTAQ